MNNFKRALLFKCLILWCGLALGQKDVLVILCHPNLEHSQVNRLFVEELSELAEISINNLYERYPDYDIDVQAEQELLKQHDKIIFQFPLYWFSSPSLLKKWMDEVITSAFSIGPDSKLKGKKLLIVVSAGGTKEDYSHEGLMKHTMDEVLVPFEAFARLTKMKFLPPFVTYAVPNPKILEIPMTQNEKATRAKKIEHRAKELIEFIESIQ